MNVSRYQGWFLSLAFFAALGGAADRSTAAEKYTLAEPATDDRVYDVSSRFELKGAFKFATPSGALSHAAGGTAQFKFSERRLPGAGRYAEALRMLRSYREAEGNFQVDKDASSLRLRDRRRLIVAQGRREGIAPYSNSGPLTRLEVDLLQMPGDNLAVLGMLPLTEVAVGQKWTPESWVIQMLAYVEAVSESNLECQLRSVDGNVARVKFSGSLKGATVGAATEVTVAGTYLFDIRGKYLKRVEYEQVEKRSVGVVSPGMDVVANVTIDRSLGASHAELTDAAVERIPLEPQPERLLLTFQTPGGAQMLHDRHWHVYQQSGQLAVLRLLERGSFVAQCNMTQIASAASGDHTPEAQFQSDIQKVLGEQFRSFQKAEQIQTGDGRFLYRITAVGETKRPDLPAPVPMTWIYYLCAAPSGQQISLVFAVESKLAEQLGNRDLSMVKSLEFPTVTTPVKARP